MAVSYIFVLKLNSANSELVTGLLLCNGAISILKDDVVAKKLGGGVLTPATLGQPFIDRLNASGFTFETKLMEN
jgi:short subunit dehydrogenase-like uncharacterized protein